MFEKMLIGKGCQTYTILPPIYQEVVGCLHLVFTLYSSLPPNLKVLIQWFLFTETLNSQILEILTKLYIARHIIQSTITLAIRIIIGLLNFSYICWGSEHNSIKRTEVRQVFLSFSRKLKNFQPLHPFVHITSHFHNVNHKMEMRILQNFWMFWSLMFEGCIYSLQINWFHELFMSMSSLRWNSPSISLLQLHLTSAIIANYLSSNDVVAYTHWQHSLNHYKFQI